jgi:hypothetical protein
MVGTLREAVLTFFAATRPGRRPPLFWEHDAHAPRLPHESDAAYSKA